MIRLLQGTIQPIELIADVIKKFNEKNKVGILLHSGDNEQFLSPFVNDPL